MSQYPSFTLLQVNVLHGEDAPARYSLLLEALADRQVDIITLQEVDHPEELAVLLAGAGFPHFKLGDRRQQRSGQDDFVAIASRHPFLDYGRSFAEGGALVQTLQLGEQIINVFSAHLFWGSSGEAERARQVELIEEEAERLSTLFPGSLSILGGDLNTTEASQTVRYLSGLSPNMKHTSSTHWVDAWSVAGSPETWATSGQHSNELGVATARSVGIRYPELLPERRIDYIFTRGWTHGRTGSPLSFSYLTHPEGRIFSDHSAILGEFLLA